MDSKYVSNEKKFVHRDVCTIEPNAESRAHAIFFKQLKRSGNDIQQFNIVVDFSLDCEDRVFVFLFSICLNRDEL